MPVAPGSDADYAHVDPSTFYENVRQLGRVVWDEGMQSWLITDFEDVSRVLRDEDAFAAPFTKLGFADFFGPRGLLLLEGEPHRQLYVAVTWGRTAELGRYRNSIAGATTAWAGEAAST